MYGSAVAILTDGTHRTLFGVFKDLDSFKRAEVSMLEAVRYQVVKYFYAWGHESQEYIPSEVLEVYFNE